LLPDPCTYGDDLTAELYDGVLTSQATREDPAKAQQAIKDALNAHIANYLEGANASGDESSPYSGYSSTAISTIQTTAVYETWDESTTSLNAVGQLVVQAIVAVATAGAGNAILAGTTAAGNAIVSAAVQSVVNQLSTEILTAVITGESLNIDLGSLVTNAVKSAVFAGVTEAMDTEMFSDAVNDEGVFNPDKLNYTQKAVRNISHASVSTLVYGGESVAAPAFNYIGHTLTGTDGLKLDKNALSTKALITTTHALVGGTIAELTGGEFSSGAVATAVGHVVAEFIQSSIVDDIKNGNLDISSIDTVTNYLETQKDTAIAIGKAVGGATVLLTQDGVTQEELDRATTMAGLVVENNSFGGRVVEEGILKAKISHLNEIGNNAGAKELQTAYDLSRVIEKGDKEEIQNFVEKNDVTQDILDEATTKVKFRENLDEQAILAIEIVSMAVTLGESAVAVASVKVLIEKYGAKEATKMIAKDMAMDVKDAGAFVKGLIGGKGRKGGTNPEFDKYGNQIVREPRTLQDKMTADAIKDNSNVDIDVKIKKLLDPKFPNHEKIELKTISNNGDTSVVHAARNKTTGKVEDIKYINHSDGTFNGDKKDIVPKKWTFKKVAPETKTPDRTQGRKEIHN